MKRGGLLVGLALSAVLLIYGFGGQEKLLALTAFPGLSTNDRDFARSQIEAGSAILVDRSTGETLFYKNDRKRMYPASTTKILTALVAIEKGSLKDTVKVGQEVNPEQQDESRAGLRPGQQYKLADLLEAMLLPSGNDAGRAVAVYTARKEGGAELGTEEALAKFSVMMNARAKEAGAKDSRFMNPSGLHDAGHYSTARDLALIAREAMKSDVFRSIVRTGSYAAASVGESGAKKLMLVNRNLLLQKDSGYYFAGANGIKTGFTDEAGYCLVSSASRGGKHLIAVVLHSTETGVYDDSRSLLERGFEQANPS